MEASAVHAFEQDDVTGSIQVSSAARSNSSTPTTRAIPRPSDRLLRFT
jgi:hypothetical protein